MKERAKKIGMMIVIIGGMAFWGCKKPVDLDAPTGLKIEEAKGLKITLTWNAVEGCEGYKVYLDGKEIAEVKETKWEGEPKELGDFCVSAYKGEDESEKSNTVSTKLETGDGIKIYERSAKGKSGCGWNEKDGKVTLYSVHPDSPRAQIDIYLDDFIANSTDPDSMCLAEPRLLDPKLRKTGVLKVDTDFDSTVIAPESGYFNRELVKKDACYILSLSRNGDDYYVKLNITAQGNDADGDYIVFKYGIQLVKNYHRLGDESK
jgi:hypothetical protein